MDTPLQPGSRLPELPQQTRVFIVCIVLVQSVVLYLLQQVAPRSGWGETPHAWEIFGDTLVGLLPTMLALSVVHLRDRRLWQHMAALTVVLAGLAACAAWRVSGASGLSAGPLLFPYYLSVGIGVFVGMAWLQARQQLGHWRAPYPLLFEYAWHNTLTLLLAAALTGLGWGILAVSVELFVMLDIDVHPVTRGDALPYLVTGLLMALGILIARTRQRQLLIARQLLLIVFKALLPLLALMVLLFLVSLLLTGLQPLRDGISADTLLTGLILLLVLFTNAVYQDGECGWPYPRGLRWLVNAALLTLPVHAGLALYALVHRVHRLDWEMDIADAWLGLLILAAAVYAVGHAVCVLRSRHRWLRPLAGVNKGLSLAVIGVIVLVNTPLLDPARIVVNDQIARLRASAPDVEHRLLRTLRFESGRRGYQALQALLSDPDIIASGADRRIAAALEGTGVFDPHNTAPDEQTLRQQITLAEGSPAPDDLWWQQLAAGTLRPQQCHDLPEQCIARQQDLNGDGQGEILLCREDAYYSAECTVHARNEQGHWRNVGTKWFYDQNHPNGTRTMPLRDALLRGSLRTHPPKWPELSLDGSRPSAIDTSPVFPFDDDDE